MRTFTIIPLLAEQSVRQPGQAQIPLCGIIARLRRSVLIPLQDATVWDLFIIDFIHRLVRESLSLDRQVWNVPLCRIMRATCPTYSQVWVLLKDSSAPSATQTLRAAF